MREFVEHPVVAEALERLKEGLSPTLTYHSYEHTLDVLSEVIILASEDDLPARDIELLAIAAAWHDVGFLYKREANESLAADALSEYLAGDRNYSPDERDLLRCMILDTAMVKKGDVPIQVSTTRLSPYLLDADLANFGRPDFFEKGELQRLETNRDRAAFQLDTLRLITRHSWLSPAAQRKWSSSKQENLEKLKILVGDLA